MSFFEFLLKFIDWYYFKFWMINEYVCWIYERMVREFDVFISIFDFYFF